MKVIIPHVIDLESTNIAANSDGTWAAGTTYGLGDLVKVTTALPNMVYRSLRSGNVGNSPPSHLEPVTVTATSTTSIALETDTKTWTVQTGKSFSPGMMVTVARSTTPNTYKATGEVTAYTTGTGALEVNVTSATGTGTYNAWTVTSVDEIGFWEEVSATEQHKMFDPYVNTKSTNEDSIEVVLNTTNADAIAMFGLTGETVDIELWSVDDHDTDQWVDNIYQLTAYDGANADYFGCHIAISEDLTTLAVGAQNRGGNRGSVYVYQWEGSGATFITRVDNPVSPTYSGYFGAAVALSGDGRILVVGTALNNSLGHGGVFVFYRSGGSYVYSERIISSNYTTMDSFGRGVSISSDGFVIAVGSPSNNLAFPGKAHVYRWSGSTYGLEKAVTVAGLAGGDQFGWKVSLNNDGNVLAVSANYDESAAENAGAVYLFDYIEPNYILRTKFTAGDASVGALFGQAISLSPDGFSIAVSSPVDVDAVVGAGKVYIYNIDGATITESKTFTPLDAALYSRFGDGVAITNGAGLLLASIGRFSTTPGTVRIYRKPVPVWSKSVSLAYGFASAAVLSDWYEYFFGSYEIKQDLIEIFDAIIYDGILNVTITAVTGTDAECGHLVVGRVHNIGLTQYGASVGVKDYSYRETDDIGRTEITQGYWAKKNDVTLYVPNGSLDSVYKVLSSLRGTPTAWSANNDSTDYEALMVYGFYNDFSVTVSGPRHSWCNLEIEGLT